MSYIDVEWTEEQVDFTLQMLINRLINSDENTETAKEEYSSDSYRIKCGNKIYVSLNKDMNRIFMILNNESAGSYAPSFLPWKNRAVKKSMKQLYSMLSNAEAMRNARAKAESNKYKSEMAMKSLFSAFPEAMTQEFEKHVLEIENGKSKSES